MSGEISFRSLIKDCAGQAQVVASFNKACGGNLRVPVVELMVDCWPHPLSEAQQLQIESFIRFVHENLWSRLRRAEVRMDRALAALPAA